ncbi:hypothetical protein [Aquimarina spongiae]|uniref:Uncharacterized protein n=1 Tax=Aquimarina spongiae TaxID=570521 RepID=A0A1M6BHZ3_9FLAO|nr:hypothetical protein [Aquimarina spongiae]SHI48306.1 hypothetical protein SAMN04488508_101841 [Aquimarina spongiae]
MKKSTSKRKLNLDKIRVSRISDLSKINGGYDDGTHSGVVTDCSLIISCDATTNSDI